MRTEMEFVELVEKTLKVAGFENISTDSLLSQHGGFLRPDLVLLDPASGHTSIVEVKLYRSGRVTSRLLRNAFAQLDSYVDVFDADHGILVVGAILDEDQAGSRTASDHEVWDFTKLLEMAASDIATTQALLNFIVSLQLEKLAPDNSSFKAELENARVSSERSTGQGHLLAQKLEASDAGRGRGASKKFEDLCQSALEFLYSDALTDWKPQKRIEKGYQRPDLVARIATKNPFWADIATDFRTRYIVFEFKNYSDQITQSEIYTTEKYLFTTALRSVAVVISRNGYDEGASRTIRGALREQGKLIMHLDLGDICVLLRGVDNGEDPQNMLVEKLDELLLSIAR